MSWLQQNVGTPTSCSSCDDMLVSSLFRDDTSIEFTPKRCGGTQNARNVLVVHSRKKQIVEVGYIVSATPHSDENMGACRCRLLGQYCCICPI